MPESGGRVVRAGNSDLSSTRRSSRANPLILSRFIFIQAAFNVTLRLPQGFLAESDQSEPGRQEAALRLMRLGLAGICILLAEWVFGTAETG